MSQHAEDFGDVEIMESTKNSTKLKQPEKMTDPWSKAKATEDKNPTLEPNPFLSSNDEDSQIPQHSQMKNCKNSSQKAEEETEEKQAPEGQTKNPEEHHEKVTDTELVKHASQAVAFFCNPLLGIMKKPPLSEDECDELAEPLAQILPRWCFHPALRAVGVGSKIFYRRRKVVDATLDESAQRVHQENAENG